MTVDVHDLRNDQEQQFFSKYWKHNIKDLDLAYWELLEESEGEITDEIEYVEKLLKDKKEYYLQYSISSIYELNAMIDAKKEHKKSLDAQIKQLEAQVEKKKEWTKFTMDNLGLDKYDCKYGKISFRKSEKVNITDLELLSDLYRVEKVTVSENKTLIKQHLKEGTPVLGAELEVCRNVQVK